MTAARLRLAFTHIPRGQWAGGHNYLRNLLQALAKHQPGRFRSVMFAGPLDDAADLDDVADIDAVEVVRCDAFDRRPTGLASAVISGLDRRAAAAFDRQRIDVVVEIARFYGWRLRLPVLAWFPDMQHRRMPHLFSMAARARRDLGFRMQVASRRTIMLSSEDARRDCARYYPAVRDRTCVVRFATLPEPALLQLDADTVRRQYDLPASFFYLPNQFWQHKNHRVVVDALALLSQRGMNIVVAATGSPADPRNPEYFRSVMGEVTARHLRENFRYLGMVPLSHVYALMRTCIALINPSQFEGWSTTVEEAKAFGVPMILSEIAVHREQTQTAARYFGVDDAVRLANHLEAASAMGGPAEPRSVVPDADKRAAAFAAEFAAAIELARRR
jgi:glycosyltransferase involved in cell wall biosynthesis